MTAARPAPLASSPAPAGAATDAPASARAVMERRIAILGRLAEIGMEIAEAVGRQATGADAPADADDGAPDGASFADLPLAFSRVARAVRLTLALQARLAQDLAGLDRAEAQDQAARAAKRRVRLHRLVEDALEDEHDPDADGDEIDRLSAEAWERLVEADEEAEVSGLPFAEAVARIAADLGLSPAAVDRLFAAAGAGLGGAPPGDMSLAARDAGGSNEAEPRQAGPPSQAPRRNAPPCPPPTTTPLGAPPARPPLGPHRPPPAAPFSAPA